MAATNQPLKRSAVGTGFLDVIGRRFLTPLAGPTSIWRGPELNLVILLIHETLECDKCRALMVVYRNASRVWLR